MTALRPRQGRIHRDPMLSRLRQRPMAMIQNGWEVLEALDRRRYLTSSQVARLLFLGQPNRRGELRGASAARKAANEVCLARLKDRGFVEVHPSYRRRPGDPSRWDRVELNVLTRAGHEALLFHKEAEGERFVSDWTPASAVPDPDGLPHQLAVRDVVIAAELGCRSWGLELLAWFDDDRLRAMVASGSVHFGTIPDVLVVVQAADRVQPLLIEVDRATETHGVWATRIQAYTHYLESAVRAESFFAGCQRPLVLTVTTAPRRLERLRETTVAAGGGRSFWFASLSDVVPPEPDLAPFRAPDPATRPRQDAERQRQIDAHREAVCRAFFSPVWQVAGGSGSWSLGKHLS